MDISAAFLLFVVSAAFTPGPNNIMIMTSGLNYGVRSSLPHLLGICFGVPTMFLAVGFGLSFIFEQYLWVHALVQLSGVIYLFYLAWAIANSEPDSLGGAGGNSTKPLSFVQAALFQWVNPKAWMMGTGAIAAFSTVGGNVNAQILTMALVFFLMAIPSAGVWLVFGASLKRVFSQRTHLVIFNRCMAALLVLSVLPIVIELIRSAQLV